MVVSYGRFGLWAIPQVTAARFRGSTFFGDVPRTFFGAFKTS